MSCAVENTLLEIFSFGTIFHELTASIRPSTRVLSRYREREEKCFMESCMIRQMSVVN